MVSQVGASRANVVEEKPLCRCSSKSVTPNTLNPVGLHVSAYIALTSDRGTRTLHILWRREKKSILTVKLLQAVRITMCALHPIMDIFREPLIL